MSDRILVPVDDWTARGEIDHAVGRAVTTGGTVTLVGLDWPTRVAVVPISAPDAATSRRRAHIAALAAHARDRARAAGVPLTVLTLTAAPLRALAAVGRGGEPAVLIMGPAAPRRRWARDLERVRRRTGCAVELTGRDAPARRDAVTAA